MTGPVERGRRNILRRAALGGASLFVVLVVALSCVSEPTAPSKSGGLYATGLSFKTVFPQWALSSQFASVTTFDHVHIMLYHTDGTVALDTTINFPSDSASVSVNLNVKLEPSAPPTGEPMTLSMGYLNAAGDQVFSAGPQAITVQASVPGQPAPNAVTVFPTYTGVGANATAVKISPRSQNVNSGAPFAFTAASTDANGGTIAGAPVVWTTLDPTRVSIPDPNVGNGTALTVRGAARIVASQPTKNGTIADTVTATVVPVAGSIAAVSGTGQTGIVGKPHAPTLAQPLIVKVLATDAQPIAGVTVTFAAANGGSVSPTTATSDANGLAQTSWTLANTPGTQTATATLASVTGSPVSFSATAQSNVATKLALTSGPTAGANLGAGAAIGLTVAAQDVDGDPVLTYTGNVTASLSSAPSGGFLGGTSTVAAVAGVATFTNLTIAKPGTGYVLSADASGLTGVLTPSFNVVSGSVANMSLLAGGGQAGPTSSALPIPILVQLTDANGNAKGGAAVTFTPQTGGGSTFPSTVTTDTAGRAASVWTLGPTPGTQALAVVSGSASLALTATATGATSHWVVTTQPAATQTAGSITPAIVAELHDASNNLVSSFTGNTTIAIGTNPTSTSLFGTTNVIAVGGVATFSAANIHATGNGYTLVIGSTGTTSVTTTPFAVFAGSAAALAIQSGNAQSAQFGQPLPQAIVAKVTDAFGNVVAGTNVAFAVSAGGGSVTPTSVASNASGLASASWTLGASGTQTLTISSTGLTGSPLTATASGGAGSIASTTVTPHLDTLTSIGDTQVLTTVARDASNNVVSGAWTYVSRTPAVATVNASGVVTAVTNGSAWIVATETGGTKDSSLTVVQQRIATIAVSPANRSLYTGGLFTFVGTAVDGRGVAMTVQPTITWTSSVPSVASINSSTGAATALQIGGTQIRATSGTTVGVSNLTVITPITRIDVTYDSTNAVAPDVFTMTSLGNHRPYRAIARDTLLNVMSGVTFTWNSTNASVAIIDTTAAARADAQAVANGVTAIQASAQGVTGSATLSVSQVLSSIDLSPTTVIVAVNGQTSMLARGKDANGRFISGGTFTYSSSAPSIATINSSSGLVTGVLNGTTNITATSGTITSNTAVVSVSNSGPAIISFGRDTIGIGRGAQLSVPVLLSKPNATAVRVNLAVADTFAFWSTAFVTIPAGQTAVNATLNGHNAGTTTITGVDGSGTGYASTSSVLSVQANLRMATGGYSLNATDQLATQVLLSDPSPPGGTYVTFQYGTPGKAQVSPNPAFIPAGQLASNVVITGVSQGSTTLTPSATGVTGTPVTVTVYAAVLNIAQTQQILGAGQFEANDYVQVPTTLNSNLNVTMTSTDTTVATAPPTVQITNGSYNYFTTSAGSPGVASIIATAPGWTPDTMRVITTTPKVLMCCNTTLNTTSGTNTVTVYAADSLRSSHDRSNSLTVRVSSSDTTVMKVIDTVATIASGTYYNGAVRVTPGVNGGTAYIKSTASGHSADSVLYTVVGPALQLSYTSGIYGAGQEEPNYYAYIPNAIGTNVVVTLTSSDSSKVATPVNVVILAGTNYTYFTLRAKAVGSAQVIATAPGYSPDTGTTIVSTPRITFSGGGTLNAFATSTVQVYTRDSVGNVHNRTAPLTVSIKSTDTTIIKIDSTATINPGTYYAVTAPTITAVGNGSAQIVVTAPGHRPDTVTYTVQAAQLNLNFGSYTIGAQQHRNATDFYASIPNARSVPVVVTLTQKHPSVVGLSTTTVTIPANSNFQYFTFAGLVPGRDTITATATGYLATTSFVTVTTPKLVVQSMPTTATTTNPPFAVTVYTADSLGSFHYSSDTLLVHAVSSDPTVIQPDSAFFHIIKDAYYAQPKVIVTGAGTATMTYSDAASTGYLPFTTNAVVVTGPSLSIAGSNPGMLGMRQMTYTSDYYVYTPNNVTTPLTINLASSSTRVATVPATITIPTGSNYTYFTITAKDTIGTIQISATATGYAATTVNMQVTAPHFVINTTSQLNTTSAPTQFYVYAADASGNYHYVADSVTVNVASSAPSVATLDSSVITIHPGQYYTTQVAHWIPGAVGTAQLSATDPRAAYYAYGTGTQNISVVTPTTSFSFNTMNLGIGQYQDQYVSVPDVVQTTPLTIPLSHAAVPHANFPSSVIIPVNTNYIYFRISGASSGTDTAFATPSGHTPGLAQIVSDFGRIDPVNSWPSTIRQGDSVLVSFYTRSPNTQINLVLNNETFTLAPNSNIQFVSGGASSHVITSVTVPAGNDVVQFYLKGVTPGPGAVTISNANYTVYQNTVPVTP